MKKLFTVMLIASCVLSCNNTSKTEKKKDINQLYTEISQNYLNNGVILLNRDYMQVDIESIDTIIKENRMNVMMYTLEPLQKKMDENSEKIKELELDNTSGIYTRTILDLTMENIKLLDEYGTKAIEFEKFPKTKNQTIVKFKMTVHYTDGTKEKHVVLPVIFDEDNEIDEQLMKVCFHI